MFSSCNIHERDVPISQALQIVLLQPAQSWATFVRRWRSCISLRRTKRWHSYLPSFACSPIATEARNTDGPRT